MGTIWQPPTPNTFQVIPSTHLIEVECMKCGEEIQMGIRTPPEEQERVLMGHRCKAR